MADKERDASNKEKEYIFSTDAQKLQEIIRSTDLTEIGGQLHEAGQGLL